MIRPSGGWNEPTVHRRLTVGPLRNRMPAQAIDPSQGWARPEYGRYMATSPSVYSAVKLRSDAITRPPLLVYRGGSSDSPRLRTRVEQSHPVVRLLERRTLKSAHFS